MQQQEPIIQVGILTTSKIQFVLNGYFHLNGKKFTGKQDAFYVDGQISFDNLILQELWFEPESENASFDILEVVIGIGFHWERKENQRFKGALKIIIEGNNLIVINRIKVEEYLTSVISSEMSATASDELLKAHAVISRSWLLCPLQAQSTTHLNHKPTTEFITKNAQKQISHIKKWYERDAHIRFDVCADDHCQRYQGITRASTSAVDKAIAETYGEVLIYEDKICDARFSKSCGGASETFENCWAEEHYPYLTKVWDHTSPPSDFALDLTQEKNAEKWIRKLPEAFCNTTDKNILSQVLNNYDQETTDFYRWKVEYTQSEISTLLFRKSGFNFGDVLDLIPIKRGESGRIIELKIVGTLHTITVGKELEIRKWLSYSHLYSSAFVIEKTNLINGCPQKFTLIGAGWGHGVGLCQIGAAVMGEKGYKYDKILLHYFKGVELKKIY